MFCRNCGKQIPDDSKFCQFCGTTIVNGTNSNQTRTQVYDGAIHKCPNCGNVLDSFDAICPSCGYEIQKAYGEKNAIDVFTENLISLNSTEKKKNYIENFNVPNTKKDLVEFSDYVVTAIQPGNDCNDSLLVMMNKICLKAEHAFASNSTTYAEFQKKHDEAIEKNEEAQKLGRKKIRKENRKRRRQAVGYAIKNNTRGYRIIMTIIGIAMIVSGMAIVAIFSNTLETDDKIYSPVAYIGTLLFLLGIVELVLVLTRKKGRQNR